MSIRHAGQPVSLFPFLAVLVCAMGALIFLLLVVTRQIRAEARAEAIQDARQESAVEVAAPPSQLPEPPQPPPEPAPMAEPDPPVPVFDDVAAEEVKWDRMLDALRERRRDGVRALSRASDAARLAETRIRELNRELAELREGKTVSASRRDELASRLKRLRDRAADLRKEIGRQRRAIRERTAEIESTESQFAFLPFDSAAGTHRRPIFIECHPDRIEFAAEKIDLTAGELAGYTRRVNPLLAGVRALVDHWSDPEIDADARKPYVLMVVRPGGIHAYYLARKLLSQLEAPIGYELVPEQMPLAWPDRDEAAAVACRKAIDQAVARRPRTGPTVAAVGRGDGRARGRLPKLTGRPSAGSVRKGRMPSASGPAESTYDGRTARVIPESASARSTDGHRATGSGRVGELTSGGRAAEVTERRGVGEAIGAPGEKTEKANPGGPESPGAEVPTFESLTVGSPSPRGATGAVGQGSDGSPRHWGVASLGATIGYERRVRVRIEPDRITVADQPRIDIRADGRGELSAAEIRQRVIRAVQLTARSWGPPPERFYWVPAIRFEVIPGGFLYYERLNILFRNWRISTSVDHVLPVPSPPPIRLMQGLFQESLP